MRISRLKEGFCLEKTILMTFTYFGNKFSNCSESIIIENRQCKYHRVFFQFLSSRRDIDNSEA